MLGLGVGIAALPAACGPSFQAIYEGNSRFEHCYALEENAQAPMHDKADCWRDWSERYTYGQTRDRVQYAIARYVALSQAPNVPTDEALMMAAPGVTPRETSITAPAPTNAFAPPPKVLGPMDAGGAPPPPRPSELPQALSTASGPAPPPLPSSDCSARCGATFQTCGGACGGPGPTADAGSGAARRATSKKQDEECRACDKTYRACMRTCFK